MAPAELYDCGNRLGTIVHVDPAQGRRLAQRDRVDLSRNRCCIAYRIESGTKPMKAKVAKVKIKIEKVVAEFRIWCDICSIRIAPNEEKTVVEDKTYHPNCYFKANAKAKA
jgi:hypothetical protein